MAQAQESPLPEGWAEAFMHKADLEASFGALQVCDHFHGDTMRGRIRTLQLRTEDAWQWFDRAEKRSQEVEKNTGDLMRVFLLEVYRFQNALLEDPEDFERAFAEPSLPEISSKILEGFPELREAVNMRKRVQGTYLLHAGRSLEAVSVFKDLAQDRCLGSDGLAHSYLSLACCHFNLGSEDEGKRLLEAAELAIHTCETLLNKGYLCGLLSALYDFRADAQKAAEWRGFVLSLPCPQATRDAFLQRGSRFVRQCRMQEYLVGF